MTSTDKKKNKRGRIRAERVKIIEYCCIGLVILLFLGLAFFYGRKDHTTAPAEADASPSPVPTEDSSIRGKNLLGALERASFDVTYLPDSYSVQSSDGIAFVMRMESDDRGIVSLSFETLFCADPEEESEIADLLRAENRKTTEALRALFDAVMPVFHRPIADSDTIVKQCQKVVKSGEPYSKHFGTYSVRITSDPQAVPQSVTIRFIRDS